MLAFGILVTAGGAIVILSRGWSGTTTGIWLVIELLAAGAFIAFACRLLLVGAYVSDKGVRIRTPLRTLAFDWSAVLSVRSQKIIRTVPQPILIVTARQVCFDLTDGQTVELPLYGAMRDAHRPWRMPDIQSAAEFDRVVAELRRLTALHQTRDHGCSEGADGRI